MGVPWRLSPPADDALCLSVCSLLILPKPAQFLSFGGSFLLAPLQGRWWGLRGLLGEWGVLALGRSPELGPGGEQAPHLPGPWAPPVSGNPQ